MSPESEHQPCQHLADICQRLADRLATRKRPWRMALHSWQAPASQPKAVTVRGWRCVCGVREAECAHFASAALHCHPKHAHDAL